MGSRSLLQGIFSIQGSNPGLQLCGLTLPAEPQAPGKPRRCLDQSPPFRPAGGAAQVSGLGARRLGSAREAPPPPPLSGGRWSPVGGSSLPLVPSGSWVPRCCQCLRRQHLGPGEGGLCSAAPRRPHPLRPPLPQGDGHGGPGSAAEAAKGRGRSRAGGRGGSPAAGPPTAPAPPPCCPGSPCPARLDAQPDLPGALVRRAAGALSLVAD